MTKSRKLFVAAMLLAGGYGAAIVLGGLTEWVLPSTDSPTATGRQTGLLSTLHGLISHRGDDATTGKLVPEADDASHPYRGSMTAARQTADQPTWLAAAPQPSTPVAVASQPEYATAPTLSDSRPIAANASDRGGAESARSGPKAHVTGVLSASAESTSRPASPWDRWPRWDAGGVAADGPVAATFQDVRAANAKTVQASYSDADVVRKNSPAKDPGAVAEDGSSGRTHVVIDGDSLAKLAQRYLGDARLDDEIYRLNRDVLASPDLLPIGVELRIPDSRLVDSTASLPAAPSLAASKPSAPSGMVPVEWTPRAFDSVPCAELLRPIPADRAAN